MQVGRKKVHAEIPGAADVRRYEMVNCRPVKPEVRKWARYGPRTCAIVAARVNNAESTARSSGALDASRRTRPGVQSAPGHLCARARPAREDEALTHRDGVALTTRQVRPGDREKEMARRVESVEVKTSGEVKVFEADSLAEEVPRKRVVTCKMVNWLGGLLTLSALACQSSLDSTDVAGRGALVDTSRGALAEVTFASAVGTYGDGCKQRGGEWTVTFAGGSSSPNELSVLRGDAYCSLTVTKLVADRIYIASPPLPVTTIGLGTPSAFVERGSTEPKFYGAATLDDPTFSRPFTITFLVSGSSSVVSTGPVAGSYAGPSSSASTVSLSEDTQLADGDSPIRATVTARTLSGRPLAGQVVTLRHAGRATIIPQTALTDVSGVATFEVLSTMPTTGALKAAVSGVDVNQSPQVSFVDDPRANGYRTTIMADSPALFWRFNEVGVATLRDSTRMLEPGTLIAPHSLSGSAGIFGTPTPGVSCAGGQGLALSPQMAFGNVFSIEAWFKTAASAGGSIATFGGLSAGGYSGPERVVYMTPSGRLVFGVYSDTMTSISTPHSYNDGVWHHVVATKSPSEGKLFVDGRLEATSQEPTSGTMSGLLRVGGGQVVGWPEGPSILEGGFEGALDEVATYPSALTAAQVLAHYLASGRMARSTTTPPSDAYGTSVLASSPSTYWRFEESAGPSFADSSGNGNTARACPAPLTYGVADFTDTPGRALSLSNGGGSCVVGSSLASNLSSYSVGAWFRSASTRGGRIVGMGSDPTTSDDAAYDRTIYLESSGQLSFRTGGRTLSSTQFVNDGLWHQVVASQDSAGVALYLDGTLQSSGSNPGAGLFRGYWKVGANSVSQLPNQPLDRALVGDIDEVAVFSSALNAAQVSSQYASVRPGWTTNLAINGSARLFGPRLRLTNGGRAQSGSAFLKSRVNISSFRTSFHFQLSAARADGFTFALQNRSANALGGSGGNLGYAGISQSACVKFDIYNYAPEGRNSIGVFSGGAAPNTPSTTLPGLDLNSGHTFLATLSYTGGLLEVRITDTAAFQTFVTTFAVDFPALVGANTAFVGFTGATGELTAIQDILSWEFSPL